MNLGYVILYVANVDATVAFYEKAFGLQCRFAHPGGYSEMETGATALAFVDEKFVASNGVHSQTVRPDALPPGFEIGLVSENVNAAYATALVAGAVPVLAPVTKPWGQVVSYVRDLNGFLVEICSKVGQ